ncbi:FadR/GntR family transcriptional regulator [Caldimonas aquatica]|uniref:FCD domain-containing protein n=1 Tax=Caldimonas aquatica TaxID=376175 RepID=A0ABY6MVE5_9BURK|nr:FCD domain-containing protein [Schlegelella aquatica]UZD55982.1 FCD domain-containing protein [Schlegelella aquatica]
MDTGHKLRQDLLHHLASGLWRPGQRLPTERELSERYQVSRTTVRRVLASLKERGLITQTVGSGTYVRGPGAGAADSSDAGTAATTSPAELMEARLALEPAIVEMVIRHATPADFQRMEECCACAEAAATMEEFEVWDAKLHETIAQATRNNFLREVFDLMNEVRSQDVWGQLKRRSLTAERRAAYQAEHRRLVAALKDRDAALARQLTLEHLLHVRRNLLGY